MVMPNNKAWLAIVFILICLAIPFGITYYVSTDTFKVKYSQWQGTMPEAPENVTLEKSRILDGHVTLVRGERIRVHSTSLVFKGMDGDQAMLDLFLEELDPTQAYSQSFPRDIARDQVLRFGDVAYTVVAVSRNTLILKIYRSMGAQ